MKSFSKNFLIHVNPIGRDLILIIALGMTIALVMVTAGTMVFSQL